MTTTGPQTMTGKPSQPRSKSAVAYVIVSLASALASGGASYTAFGHLPQTYLDSITRLEEQTKQNNKNIERLTEQVRQLEIQLSAVDVKLDTTRRR